MTLPFLKRPLFLLFPFWIFILFFKFGAGLHYTLLSFLGEQILPLWIVGLIVGAASLFQLLLDVPAGYLLDRFGYVRLLRLGTIAFICAALILFWFDLSIISYLLTIGLATVGWLFFGPGVNAYILSKATPEVAGRYIGLSDVFESGGIVLAAGILSFVIGFSSQMMGLLIAGILAIGLFSIFFTPNAKPLDHSKKKIRRQHYYIHRHFLHHVLGAVRKLNPASVMIIIQSLSSSILYGMIWFIVPLVLAEGLHTDFLGISLSIFDLAVVLLGSFFGYLADKYERKKLIFMGLLTFAISSVFLGFNFNIWFLVLGFLATSGDEMAKVSLWAWLDQLDKDHAEDGLINGVIIFFEDLGWMIGPIIAGFLFTLIGPSWAIALGAIPVVLTWLISLFFLKPPSRRGESDPLLAPVRVSRHKR